MNFNQLILFAIFLSLNNQVESQTKTTKLWSRINLPDEHLPYFFNLNPRLKKKCSNDEMCPFKQHLNSSLCYGYEKKCAEKNRLFSVECPEDSRGWVNLKKE